MIKNRNFLSGVGVGSFAYVGRPFFNGSNGSITNSSHIYLALEVGELCNLSCRHCIYHRSLQGPLPNQEVLDYICSLLAEGKIKPMWLSLAGKEPTLFPEESIKVLQAARMVTQVKTIIMTNGLMLQKEKLRRSFSKLVDLIDVSIDGDETYHEWMRGKGTFNKTFSVVKILETDGFFVSVIATAVNLPEQIQSIIYLAKRLNAEKMEAPLSISLYYGPPGDPLRLKTEVITYLVKELTNIEYESRILFTAHYACEWPKVKEKLQINNQPVHVDRETEIPFVKMNDHLHILLFQETMTPQYRIRVSNDGLVYLGCNHLTLDRKAQEFAIGNYKNLEEIFKELSSVKIKSPKLRSYLELELPSDCLTCEFLYCCRRGDMQSGIYHNGEPRDSYCGLLNSSSLLPLETRDNGGKI